jgi:hypothetical protein
MKIYKCKEFEHLFGLKIIEWAQKSPTSFVFSYSSKFIVFLTLYDFELGDLRSNPVCEICPYVHVY